MVAGERSEREHEDDESLGVLDDAASVDTTGIGILGGTAQVSVSLPLSGDDDDDDDVVDDDAEIAEFLAELDGDELDEVDEAPPVDTVDETSTVTDAEIIDVAVETDAVIVADTESEVAAHAPVPDEGEFSVPETPEPAAVPTVRVGAEAARVAPLPEAALTAKRLGDLGEASRESADLLTSDRLVGPTRRTKPEPEGVWAHLLYTASGRRINIGDSKKVRARKALSARIATKLPGGARFVAVLSRKGGVGKTTVTTLLGMALADAREDRVVAVDANPDRGTLADRIAHRPGKSVRDLARLHSEVHGYQDISAIVGRDATRLDVLASDADPHIAEAFSDVDYRSVADVAAQYYSLVLTDTGTGIVHEVMRATLDLADRIVIVTGLSVDEARLASETLTWLESNDRADIAREAIVVLNQAMPGRSPVQDAELEKHFASRVRHVVRIPFDPQIATGGEISFADLRSDTRQAARELAAVVVESLRAKDL